MAIIFKPRKSTLAGAVPTTSQLQDGEMAVNTTDKKIFIRVGAAIVEMFKALTKADVGLSNVDNTSDMAKPVSTATATALAAKANATHNHSISNVTGLQTALDGKQAAGSYAAASHTHTIANVSNLQDALDGKANSNNASFTNAVNIGGAVDLSVQLNPTGGRSIRFAATATPNCGVWDATNSTWLFRIDANNNAHVAGDLNAKFLIVEGPAPGSQQSHLAFRRGGSTNWQFGTEADGSMSIWSYDNAGGYTGNPVTIYRGENQSVQFGIRGGLRVEGGEVIIRHSSPTIQCYDTDNGNTSWIHYNDGNHGFLSHNVYSWCAFRDSSDNWNCTGNIIAYASDARLKTNFRRIDDPLLKLSMIDGLLFDWDTEACEAAGFTPQRQTEHGFRAQDIQQILPDIVVPAPFNKDYLTVMYDRMTPFLVAVDKAQQSLIEDQANRIRDLEDRLARIEKALGV